MTDLLSRLYAATGPSRELDAEIALANGWTVKKRPLGELWTAPNGDIEACPPPYTESIDATMSLLSDRPCVLKIKNANGKAEARVGGLPGEGFVIKGAEHCVPAIALVIACLKARMEKDNAGQ